MPRLVGKQSNKTGSIAVFLAAIAAFVLVLEYSGLIDFIPQFGRQDVSLIREQNVR